MGMFSGGFLGGGTDESSTTSSTHTEVHTTTETTVHDIGLTGANAENMAAILAAAAVEMTQIGSNTALGLAQQAGQNYTELVGGTNQLIGEAVQAESANYQRLISITPDITNPSGADNKQFMYVAVAAVVMFGLVMMNQRARR